jgi:hypothetical protein
MSKWQKVIDAPGNFPMCGVYFNDKLYLGGYGSGAIYSWMPLDTELDNSGESILGMVEHKGSIYAASENNDMEGQHTRVLRRTPGAGWVDVGIQGYAAFFMTTWNGFIVVTATTDLHTVDYWFSADGNSFQHGQKFDNWVWVPAVFKGELYFLGHYGRVEDNLGSCAIKWNGTAFVEVPALCHVPGVLEWQCATEHNGAMYLGSGGWVLGRGTSPCGVWKFDGNSCVQVFDGAPQHECQALLSSKFNGYLYASFGNGFKTDEGGSQIRASLDGETNWLDAGAFDCPQMYVLLDTPYGFIAAGGAQGNLQIHFFDTQAVQPGPTPLPPAPTQNTCPKCGYQW